MSKYILQADCFVEDRRPLGARRGRATLHEITCKECSAIVIVILTNKARQDALDLYPLCSNCCNPRPLLLFTKPDGTQKEMRITHDQNISELLIGACMAGFTMGYAGAPGDWYARWELGPDGVRHV